MKEKENNDIVLNGVKFTPAMMKALKEWYTTINNLDENAPAIMIGCLHAAVNCLIDLSQEMYEKDKQIMSALRQLKFVEEELKPFLEGSAV